MTTKVFAKVTQAGRCSPAVGTDHVTLRYEDERDHMFWLEHTLTRKDLEDLLAEMNRQCLPAYDDAAHPVEDGKDVVVS